jgi:hypothetical protein
MARQGEFEYYSTRSGLTSGSLADHKVAFWKQTNGLSVGTFDDHQLAYYQVANADTTRALHYQQYKFFSTKVGHGGSLTDVMRDFFLAPPSGGKPQHRVWGGGLSPVLANDGQPVRLANAFYVVGLTGWKIVGGRVWAASAGAAFTGFKGQVWAQGIGSIASPATPLAEVALTAAAGANRYTDFTVSPIVMTAGVPYYIGYESSSGDYFYDASQPSSFVQASDGVALYLASTSEVGFSRGLYAYTGGNSGGSAAAFGIDILVEEP